jgi:hypothetical protein
MLNNTSSGTMLNNHHQVCSIAIIRYAQYQKILESQIVKKGTRNTKEAKQNSQIQLRSPMPERGELNRIAKIY